MEFLYICIIMTAFLGIVYTHTFKTAGFEHLGCFRDGEVGELRVLKDHEQYLPELTIESCLLECTSAKMTYFGVEQVNMCYCGKDGSDFETHEKSSDCITPCAGNTSQVCGGQYAIDVFKIEVKNCPKLKSPQNGKVYQRNDTAWFDCLAGYRLRGTRTLYCNRSTLQWMGRTNPVCHTIYENQSRNQSHRSFEGFRYIGCFRNVESDSQRIFRQHGRYIPGLTLEVCHIECSAKMAWYFGVEDSRMCYCGKRASNYRIYGVSDECVRPCGGNSSQKCGGHLAIGVFIIGRKFCLPLEPPIHGRVTQTTSRAWFECTHGYCLQGSKVANCNTSNFLWNRLSDTSCQKCNVSNNIKDDNEATPFNYTQEQGLSASTMALIVLLCTTLGFACGLSIGRKLVWRQLEEKKETETHEGLQSQVKPGNILPVSENKDNILSESTCVTYQDCRLNGKSCLLEEDPLYMQMYPICDNETV